MARYYRKRRPPPSFGQDALYVQDDGSWRMVWLGGIERSFAGMIPEDVAGTLEEISLEQFRDATRPKGPAPVTKTPRVDWSQWWDVIAVVSFWLGIAALFVVFVLHPWTWGDSDTDTEPVPVPIALSEALRQAERQAVLPEDYLPVTFAQLNRQMQSLEGRYVAFVCYIGPVVSGEDPDGFRLAGGRVLLSDSQTNYEDVYVRLNDFWEWELPRRGEIWVLGGIVFPHYNDGRDEDMPGIDVLEAEKVCESPVTF